MNIERENFEKRFDAAEKEVLVLTEGGTSASRWGNNKLLEEFQKPVILYLEAGEDMW